MYSASSDWTADTASSRRTPPLVIGLAFSPRGLVIFPIVQSLVQPWRWHLRVAYQDFLKFCLARAKATHVFLVSSIITLLTFFKLLIWIPRTDELGFNVLLTKIFPWSLGRQNEFYERQFYSTVWLNVGILEEMTKTHSLSQVKFLVVKLLVSRQS